MNVLSKLYWSRSYVSCFEGEGAGDGTGNANAGAGDGSAGGAAGGGQSNAGQGGNVNTGANSGATQGGAGGAKTTFSQEDVNRFLAEDRRKHQTALAQMRLSCRKLSLTSP